LFLGQAALLRSTLDTVRAAKNKSESEQRSILASFSHETRQLERQLAQEQHALRELRRQLRQSEEGARLEASSRSKKASKAAARTAPPVAAVAELQRQLRQSEEGARLEASSRSKKLAKRSKKASKPRCCALLAFYYAPPAEPKRGGSAARSEFARLNSAVLAPY
jgi:hypothetical protein